MTPTDRAKLYAWLGYSALRIAEITGISITAAIQLKSNGELRR